MSLEATFQKHGVRTLLATLSSVQRLETSAKSGSHEGQDWKLDVCWCQVRKTQETKRGRKEHGRNPTEARWTEGDKKQTREGETRRHDRGKRGGEEQKGKRREKKRHEKKVERTTKEKNKKERKMVSDREEEDQRRWRLYAQSKGFSARGPEGVKPAL